MAVSNIFKELKNNTGTFLMFSQYVEDLTRESTHSVYYHVTPSKFLAMDIDYSSYDNISISKTLQNKFENGCAVCRKEMEDIWTPNNSSNLFWNTMFNNGLLTVSESDNKTFIDQIMYVGDINIQSYNEHDGLGYSEIYCYIPNEAKEGRYEYHVLHDDISYTSSNSLEGYSPYELDGWCSISSGIQYHPLTNYRFSWDDDTLLTKTVESNFFNINTIVLLYDVTTKTSTGYEYVYKNIPMGIYFTGLINGNNLTNYITKYVSNDDIFGTGTGYGLRVCSRFSVSPNQDNIKTIEVTADSGDYAAISQVMSQMSISQSKMDEILNKIQNNKIAEKELLSIFKNSRTNVPYIKNINGENYWFVNGRKLDYIDPLQDRYIPYEDYEIMDMLNKAYNLLVNIFATNENGETVFDYSVVDSQDIYLNWEIMFSNRNIKADKLYLNDEQIDNNLTETFMSDVDKTTTYTLKVEKDGLITSNSATVHFVWPTFFGTMPCDSSCGDGVVHNFNPLPENIKKLNKYINTSKQHKYTYSNITRSNHNTDHVVLAYPAEFGTIDSILDNYGYEYKDDFNLIANKPININGKNILYNVYVDKIPAEVYDFTLSFK